MTKKRRLLMVAAVLPVVLVVPVVAATAVAGTADDSATAGASRPLDWGPCEGGGGPSGMECTRLAVPVDWANPRGRKIELALGRLRHDGPGRSEGAVLANFGAGAPGVSFLRDMYAGSFAGLRHEMDIVTWDPRGYSTGTSTQLPCRIGSTPDPALPNDQADFDRIAADVRAAADTCRNGDPALFDSIGSETHARDMDAIRHALGEDRINLYMASYGGAFGQAYARLFPQRLRTMVLDSTGNMTDIDRENLARAADSERRMARFTDWCAAEPSCALHGRNVPQVWQTVVARADRDPLVGADGREFDGRTLQFLLAANLIWALAGQPGGGFAPVAASIAAAERGDVSGFAALPQATSQSPDIIACSDFPRFADYAEFAAAVARLRAAAPNTGIGGASVGRLGCVGSPAPVTYPSGPLPQSLPPLLGIGAVDVDFPATDRAVRQVRGSASIPYDGPGHVFYTADVPCVTEHVNRYFLTRTLPPDGTRCQPV